MKKVLAAAVAVCVICLAGSALAYQGEQMRHQPRGMQPQNFRSIPDFRGPAPHNVSGDMRGPHGDFRPQFDGRQCRFDGRRRGPMFTPDMPQEIRAKATELAKLRVDLDEAMTARPLNKEKALEVFAKIQKAEQEIDAWRFAQRLERIEAWQKQNELNRTVPPAPPAPVPAPEAPAE
ncbi:MAG: hypothetical protein IJP86_03715 [Synergistaceae bacterium]|nr:hypothetical protein [Synergistaceae bacterium]